jgi:hypothetical protein
MTAPLPPSGAEIMAQAAKDLADGFTPEVVLLADLQSRASLCMFCGMPAVVPLTRKQRARQPDDTTHVCHPTLGGCNQGFAKVTP